MVGLVIFKEKRKKTQNLLRWKGTVEGKNKEEFRLVYNKLVHTNNRRAEKNGTTFKVIVIVYHTVSNTSNKNNILFVNKNLKNVARDKLLP